MRLFRFTASSDHPEVAKNQAVSTTLSLILTSYLTAFIATVGVPFLLSLLLTDKTPKNIEKSIDIFAGALVSLFFIKWSWDQINATVGSAIDAAAEQQFEAYIGQYPDVQERLETKFQEYSCTIPPIGRSEFSADVNLSICNRRIGRDGVIRSLAYNDDLLQDIALAAVRKALKETREEVPQDLYETFFTDVYTYLKAWLMLSITHDYVMPINYIRQRYPTEQCPNKRIYVRAIELIRAKGIKDTFVLQVIRSILKDNDSVTQTINILDKYLGILIIELKK